MTFSPRKPWVSTGVQEARTHRTGEGRTAPKREDPRTETRTRVNTAGDKQYFYCRQWGHLKYDCPKQKISQTKADPKPAFNGTASMRPEGSEKYLKWGKVEGVSTQMLVDSGCSHTMVSANSIDPDRVNNRDTVPVLCIHGDTVEYPTAVVNLSMGGYTGRASVAVAPSLPVPVLLGRDLYDINSGWKTPEAGYLVETRSQKKRQELVDLLDQEEQAGLSELFDQPPEKPRADVIPEVSQSPRREGPSESTPVAASLPMVNSKKILPMDASKEQT